ncbi:MAG: GC-type dockerin domain-anchored protein [Phycisphaerales bacterium]
MNRATSASLALMIVASAAVAQSETITVEYDMPSLDRWNYPFNGSPGTRLSASTFGAVELEGFDDHDAQFIVGFETLADVMSGLDASEYQVLSARVTITNSNGDEFRYDPTYDTHDTYLFLDDSLDTDDGRPVHMWAIGYRDEQSQSTWGEYSAFGGIADVDPAQGSRYAHAAFFPFEGSEAVDVSNNLKEEFDATPMAIAKTDAALPGGFVPADSDFYFDVDLCQPGVRGYLAEGLSLGEVRFAITSLHAANGGDGGGTGDITYPFWYTKENPIASIFGYAPRLELTVRVGSAGDFNSDGEFNFFDVSEFLSAFNAGDISADLNGDCQFNFFDVSEFLTAYNAG